MLPLLSELLNWVLRSDQFDLQVSTSRQNTGFKESGHKEMVVKLGIIPDLDWLIWEPMLLIEGLQDESILMICREDILLGSNPKGLIPSTNNPMKIAVQKWPIESMKPVSDMTKTSPLTCTKGVNLGF
ncbi:hypothetical protein OSB04_un000243 [Centaurea solstitialis]|uniref:Uncharacterized protein n=1 Tax=Centaurea solstitialis TaxID=347529 RepID=A0AA38S4P4_9ASTR|nr:hypothetical protein OSB04_un000243 [Centaurea solstitialis]